MKKLLSLVCVLALALALCVPAFAEDATPGQVVVDQTNYVTEHPEDYEAAKALNDTLKASPSVFVDSRTTEAMAAALLAAENSGFSEDFVGDYDWGVLTISNGRYLNNDTGLSVPANNSFTLTTFWELEDGTRDDNYQSDLGAIVTVRVPASSIAMANDYMWRNESGQYGYVEASLDDDDPGYIYFTFFAPHFSTYTIYRSTPASDPAPAASSSSSVLARTNADLNLTAVVLAALALVLTAGCAAWLKKRALNK